MAYLLQRPGGTPEIHKPNNAGRTTDSLCLWLLNGDHYCLLAPFVKSFLTLCERHNALDIFDSFRFNTTTGNHFLFTMDVNSPYPVIQNDSGLQTLAYFLDKREVKETSTSPAPHKIVKISRAGVHLKFIVVLAHMGFLFML